MLHLVPAAGLSVAALIAELPAAGAFHIDVLRFDQLAADQRIKPFNTVFHNINPFCKIRIRIRPPAGADLPPIQVFVPSVGKPHQATSCGQPQ